MSNATKVLSSWNVLALFAVTLTLTGCGKAGPAAVKSLGKAEQAAVKQKGGFLKGAKEVGNEAVKQFGPDIAKDQLKQWEQRMKAGRDDPPGESRPSRRFPLPPSSVQPLQGYQPRYDPDSGRYAMPNNYGGVNMYEAGGSPVGFSAYNKTTGQIHYFDSFGNEV